MKILTRLIGIKIFVFFAYNLKNSCFHFYLTYKNQTFPKCQRCRSESLILTNDLQLLDTQLAVCRREGETSYDANGDEIIPRWVPSHLDLRQRTAFSL